EPSALFHQRCKRSESVSIHKPIRAMNTAVAGSRFAYLENRMRWSRKFGSLTLSVPEPCGRSSDAPTRTLFARQIERAGRDPQGNRGGAHAMAVAGVHEFGEAAPPASVSERNRLAHKPCIVQSPHHWPR